MLNFQRLRLFCAMLSYCSVRRMQQIGRQHPFSGYACVCKRCGRTALDMLKLQPDTGGTGPCPYRESRPAQAVSSH